MDSPDSALLLTAVVIGLFIGTNLGVLIMCLLRMVSADSEPEAELAPRSIRGKD